jgi:uncharacterized membrane protein
MYYRLQKVKFYFKLWEKMHKTTKKKKNSQQFGFTSQTCDPGHRFNRVQ